MRAERLYRRFAGLAEGVEGARQQDCDGPRLGQRRCVAFVGVFEMGLRMAGADAQWTFLLIGVLIIAAVTTDQWIRKVSS